MQKARSLNDNIEIKLTPAGAAYLKSVSDSVTERFPILIGIYSHLLDRPDDWHPIQLHSIIVDFADYSFVGRELPFTWRLPPEPPVDHECVDG